MQLFSNHAPPLYHNTDVVGGRDSRCSQKYYRWAGAGALHGSGYMTRIKAAIITRGLVEITRLGVKLGASPLTHMAYLESVTLLLLGLPSTRNWRAGDALDVEVKN